MTVQLETEDKAIVLVGFKSPRVFCRRFFFVRYLQRAERRSLVSNSKRIFLIQEKEVFPNILVIGQGNELVGHQKFSRGIGPWPR